MEGCISTPIPNYLSTYYFLSFSPHPRDDDGRKERCGDHNRVVRMKGKEQCGDHIHVTRMKGKEQCGEEVEVMRRDEQCGDHTRKGWGEEHTTTE